MINAHDPDVADRLPDMADRVLLIYVAMHGQEIALRPRSMEHLRKFARRGILFIRIEPHANDPLLVGERLQEGGHGKLGAPIPEKAHDELRTDPERGFCLHLGAADTPDDRIVTDTARSMRLRIKKH